MKSNIRKTALVVLMFTICLSIIPVALAKTRQSHIIYYIYEKQNSDETFGSTPQDTAYALEIIDYYNSYSIQDIFGVKYSVDKTLLEENLIDDIQNMFDSGIVDIYDLYYSLKSLEILKPLDESLETTLHENIYNYINETYHVGGGFKASNTSISANMISTYYIFKIYILINEPILNQTLHKDWILSCNNTDGGYGGNQTLSSTLLTTLYAIELIDLLNASLVNQFNTLNYIESFYINDASDLINYGGYLPDSVAERALLSSTYFSTRGLSLIDTSYLSDKATTKWVLGLQNFQDGGFAENLGVSEQKKSSIKATYYAFNILKTFNALSLLNEDIFMVEFNFIILIIVLSSIGLLIVLIYVIYRKRKI